MSFLEKLDIRHKGCSDDITHRSLDSQIMRNCLVDMMIKTILFSIFLVVRENIDIAIDKKIDMA